MGNKDAIFIDHVGVACLQYLDLVHERAAENIQIERSEEHPAHCTVVHDWSGYDDDWLAVDFAFQNL